MTWERGRAEIERLIQHGELEPVQPSEQVAPRLLADAERHVRLASKGTEDDPAGSLQLAYDAAREAAAALLAAQGLRAPSRGGHLAVLNAVRERFGRGTKPVFDRIDRLRRRRNESEYPSTDSPGITQADAEQAIAIAIASETIDAAKKLPATNDDAAPNHSTAAIVATAALKAAAVASSAASSCASDTNNVS